MTDLEWDIQELQFLLKDWHCSVARAVELDTLCSKESEQSQSTALSQFRTRAESIVYGVVRKQREPASRVMVFMITPEG